MEAEGNAALLAAWVPGRLGLLQSGACSGFQLPSNCRSANMGYRLFVFKFGLPERNPGCLSILTGLLFGTAGHSLGSCIVFAWLPKSERTFPSFTEVSFLARVGRSLLAGTIVVTCEVFSLFTLAS